MCPSVVYTPNLKIFTFRSQFGGKVNTRGAKIQCVSTYITVNLHQSNYHHHHHHPRRLPRPHILTRFGTILKVRRRTHLSTRTWQKNNTRQNSHCCRHVLFLQTAAPSRRRQRMRRRRRRSRRSKEKILQRLVVSGGETANKTWQHISLQINLFGSVQKGKGGGGDVRVSGGGEKGGGGWGRWVALWIYLRLRSAPQTSGGTKRKVAEW